MSLRRGLPIRPLQVRDMMGDGAVPQNVGTEPVSADVSGDKDDDLPF